MGRTFACADIHGCYEPYRKMMDFLQSDDTLYFVGDAMDRGLDGVKIFNELINDSRVVYIRGNHEDMMEDAIPYCVHDINEYEYMGGNHGYDLWFQNGGRYTAQAFYNMTVNEIYNIREKIKEIHSQAIYASPAGHKVILEHAGYSPFITPHRTHDPLWDRKHFYDDWSDGYWNYKKYNPETTYLVHGHTPVQYLQYEYGYKDQPPKAKEDIIAAHDWLYGDDTLCPKPTIIRYCDNHKFDIDMCTIVSRRVALLDLDTFEEYYFDTED